MNKVNLPQQCSLVKAADFLEILSFILAIVLHAPVVSKTDDFVNGRLIGVLSESSAFRFSESYLHWPKLVNTTLRWKGLTYCLVSVRHMDDLSH